MCVEREIAIDDGEGMETETWRESMEREGGWSGKGERGRETERGRESHDVCVRSRAYAIDPTISDTRYMRLYASKIRVMCHCVISYVRCLTFEFVTFQ